MSSVISSTIVLMCDPIKNYTPPKFPLVMKSKWRLLVTCVDYFIQQKWYGVKKSKKKTREAGKD